MFYMKIKNNFFLILFSVIIMIGIIGCSNDTKSDDKENNKTNKDIERFTMGTSSSGGAVYAIGAGISEILNKAEIGVNIRAISTGGAVDNIGLLNKNEVEFAVNASNTNFL